MDAYDAIILHYGHNNAAEMLADECRVKDRTIETLQGALRSLSGYSIVSESEGHK